MIFSCPQKRTCRRGNAPPCAPCRDTRALLLRWTGHGRQLWQLKGCLIHRGSDRQAAELAAEPLTRHAPLEAKRP